MCGIVGILKKNLNVSKEEIQRMYRQFIYRGPDDEGSWLHPQGMVGFGHKRLSVIDPSPSGHQPMNDPKSGLTIVYNGEIYNYIEIKVKLQKKGYLFKTQTDTEVILKAYEQWGVNSLKYLNGMFAFAIWDEKKQVLFLARDRLGIKPLYYFSDDSGFFFASEVKAILAVLKSRPSLFNELIDAYMTFGYIPGEDTFFKGIKRLLPGHYMMVNLFNKEIHKYWDLNFDNKVDLGQNYYLDKSRELLNDAIKLRLRSDVPLGIFLSGGIDSSTVVSLLAPRISERLKTFSVAYDFGPEYDETSYSKLVASRFNTDHHEIYVTPKEFVDFIPNYIWLMDEPVTEAAAISLYFVSKLAKEYVTVVLSGEGSDEIFAGYDLYRYMLILEKYRKILGNTCSKLIAKFGNIFLAEGNKLRKYLILGGLSLEERYKGISIYEHECKSKLYQSDFSIYCKNTLEHHPLTTFILSLFERTRGYDPLSRMLYFDIKTWLVDDLLIKADRMSMAASLELRVPFLDYRLVEFAATIPSKYKINKRANKYILKKMGFPTPLKIMFEKDLYEYARDILLSDFSNYTSYFKRNEVERLLNEHVSGRKDNHRVLWQLVVLETWFRIYKSTNNYS